MTSTAVVSKKWGKQVNAYLNSLPADRKATQEGCIADTGISPGFIEFLKSQGRNGHADNYLKAMKWHLRYKDTEPKKRKTTYQCISPVVQARSGHTPEEMLRLRQVLPCGIQEDRDEQGARNFPTRMALQ